MKKFEGTVPPPEIMKIWCDFNAWGLSNESDDNCFYSFDRNVFTDLNPTEGQRIFIWDDDSNEEIIGYIAILERYPQHITGWRARPDESTLYRGEKWW